MSWMRIANRKTLEMAAGNEQNAFDAAWDTVRAWPTPERRSLASRILASLDSDEQRLAQRPARDLIGAWRKAGTLDDAATEALLENALVRKHG